MAKNIKINENEIPKKFHLINECHTVKTLEESKHNNWCDSSSSIFPIPPVSVHDVLYRAFVRGVFCPSPPPPPSCGWTYPSPRALSCCSRASTLCVSCQRTMVEWTCRAVVNIRYYHARDTPRNTTIPAFLIQTFLWKKNICFHWFVLYSYQLVIF